MKTMVISAKTKQKPNPVKNKPLTKSYHKPKMKQSRKDKEKHSPWVPEVIQFPNIKQSLTVFLLQMEAEEQELTTASQLQG